MEHRMDGNPVTRNGISPARGLITLQRAGILLAGAAAAAAAVAAGGQVAPAGWWGPALFAVLAAGARTARLELPSGEKVTAAPVLLVAALVLFPPAPAAAVAAAAAVAGTLHPRRRSAWFTVTAAAAAAVTMVPASLLLHAGQRPVDAALLAKLLPGAAAAAPAGTPVPAGLLLLPAALLVHIITWAAVTAALVTAAGPPLRGVWRDTLNWLVPQYLAAAGPGLVLALTFRLGGIPGALLLALPFPVLRHLWNDRIRLRRRLEQQEQELADRLDRACREAQGLRHLEGLAGALSGAAAVLAGAGRAAEALPAVLAALGPAVDCRGGALFLGQGEEVRLVRQGGLDPLSRQQVEAWRRMAAVEAASAQVKSVPLATMPGGDPFGFPGEGGILVVLPLVWQDQRLGAAIFACSSDGARDLRTAGAVLGTLLAAAAAGDALREQARRQAETDTLTGILHRQAFNRLLEEKAAHATPTRPTALLLVDIDDFQLFNQVHGLAAGDRLLAHTARTLKALVRPGDGVARYADDTFAILLTDLTDLDTLVAARRIQRGLERSPWITPGGETVRLTVSIGAAVCPGDAGSAGALAAAAEAALARAGRDGSLVALYSTVTPGETGGGTAGSRGSPAPTPAELVAESAFETLRHLAGKADARHPTTFGHSRRAARYAAAIALEMALSDTDLETVRRAALLHDVGKVAHNADMPAPVSGVAPARADPHPATGARILQAAGARPELVRAVYHHHEAWDGRGYPDRLAGEEIPVASRIIAVADAMEHLTAGRDGDQPCPEAAALDRVMAEAGTRFDPAVVLALRRYLEERAITAVEADRCAPGRPPRPAP